MGMLYEIKKPFFIIWCILFICFAGALIVKMISSSNFSIEDISLGQIVLYIFLSPILIFMIYIIVMLALYTAYLMAVISQAVVYPLVNIAKGFWIWPVAILGVCITLGIFYLIGKTGLFENSRYNDPDYIDHMIRF